MAGGKKLPEFDALENGLSGDPTGAAGVDMGRNIFQSDSPIAMIQAVARWFTADRAPRMPTSSTSSSGADAGAGGMTDLVGDLLDHGHLLSVGAAAADLLHLGDELDQVARGGVELIHIDVMDGVFCPPSRSACPSSRRSRRWPSPMST